MRWGGFYPSVLERSSRSVQAMNLALTKMYMQGVSTRNVITVLQKLMEPGISISSCEFKSAGASPCWARACRHGMTKAIVDAQADYVLNLKPQPS